MTASLFRFYNPVKIISGEKALDSLGHELKQLGAKRPLIITDQGVAAAGLIAFVKEALDGAGILGDILYDRVPPDSSPQMVDEAAAIFRQNDCDALVAVGGGSVIDTGKAVNMVVSEGVGSLTELAGVKLRQSMQPVVVVPTTAGTGSEVTYAAMIMDIETKQKREMQNELYKTTKLPRTLTEDGVPKQAFEEIAQKALKDPALTFNPLPPADEDILDILNKACR